jgi:zinc protease
MGITSDDLETAMRLESDRFQRLSYSTSEFETEAGAVYGEYRKNRMSPVFTLYEAVHETAFDHHTYGHTTMGYERDIKEMPKMFDYSRSFFSRYYRPENVVLVLVGDIEPQPTLALVRKYYGDWRRGYVAPVIASEPPQSQERTVEVSYEGQTLPLLWLAYKVDRFDPADRRLVAASLLAELAFGETSELQKKLVLAEQEVEFIAAELGTNRDPGLFDIYTRIKKPERVDYVLQEIDRVIAEHQQSPVDPQRLADLKSRLKYDFLMNLDTPDRVASALARIVAVTGGIEAVDRLYATYELVTPADVQAAARTYLVPGRRTRAVLRGKS